LDIQPKSKIVISLISEQFTDVPASKTILMTKMGNIDFRMNKAPSSSKQIPRVPDHDRGGIRWMLVGAPPPQCSDARIAPVPADLAARGSRSF
jgi:hypothetical protein